MEVQASRLTFFHGTALASAEALLSGEPLDPACAIAEKKDGPPGFFLATLEDEAEHFGYRRSPGAVVVVEMTPAALDALKAAGAVVQPIPGGPRSMRFQGRELWIPLPLFGLFNELREAGHVHIHA